MNKVILVFSIIIVVLIIVCIGAYVNAGYLLNKYEGPEYLFVHPTIAKLLNATPVCPQICIANGGVCGKDGKTYCNMCLAFQHGAGYAHDGACVKPAPADPTAGWQTYTDAVNGVQLKYPKTFSGAVWQAQTWPPTVSVSNSQKGALENCGVEGLYFSSSNQGVSFTDLKAPPAPENITINNRQFILYKGTGVGAGQLYTDYCFIFGENNKSYYSINFVIHSTNGCGAGNCGPWCGTPNEQACKTFDMQKEVVSPIEQIVSTFKLTK